MFTDLPFLSRKCLEYSFTFGCSSSKDTIHECLISTGYTLLSIKSLGVLYTYHLLNIRNNIRIQSLYYAYIFNIMKEWFCNNVLFLFYNFVPYFVTFNIKLIIILKAVNFIYVINNTLFFQNFMEICNFRIIR